MRRFRGCAAVLLAAAQLAVQVTASGTSTYTEARIFAGTFESQGATVVTKTTDSSSSTTGALMTTGGLGITKNLHVGGTRAKIGGVAEVTFESTSAYFCHTDQTAQINCGFRQNAGGSVELNAATGQTTTFKINDVDKWTMDSTGQVGIGTTTPSMRLDVNGGVQGTLAYSSNSDGRYKKNVKRLPNALATIKNLTGISFDWRHDEFPKKDFGSGSQVGFIAQHVERIIPEIVTTDSKGYKGVQYSQLTAHLTEAVKELAVQNEGLQEENDLLHAAVDSLTKRMLQMEHLMAKMQLVNGL